MTTRLPKLVIAATLASAPGVALADKIDTEHLFGFAIGTDIGEVGEKEIESQTGARLGKRTGKYAALSQSIEAEFTPTENFRFSVGGSFAYHDVAGVNGIDDRRKAAFDAVSVDMRYRFLDRATSPFGLAIDVEPHWGRIEESSGEPADRYGVDLAIAIDKELVPNMVVATFNLLYGVETMRSRETGEVSREASIGIASALMTQVHPGIFLGVEARYLRAYEGLGFNVFAGHAVFLGPTMFAKLPGNGWMSIAWSTQIAGAAAGDSARLDLTNFEQHQVRVKLGFNY